MYIQLALNGSCYDFFLFLKLHFTFLWQAKQNRNYITGISIHNLVIKQPGTIEVELAQGYWIPMDGRGTLDVK